MAAGSASDNTLYLGSATTNSILVSVSDSAGANVTGATVTLAKTGFSQSTSSSACGNAYFGSLTSGSTYSITISKTGYTTTIYNNVSISGDTYFQTSFP